MKWNCGIHFLLTQNSLQFTIYNCFKLFSKIINPVTIESTVPGGGWSDESDTVSVFKEFLSNIRELNSKLNSKCESA